MTCLPASVDRTLGLVIGQAAWFDQRVRVERVAAEDRPEGRGAQPQFPILPDPPRAGGGRGTSFRRKLENTDFPRKSGEGAA